MRDQEVELTPETSALLAQARTLQPPQGARERVLAGALRGIAERPGRMRKLAWAGGGLALAGAAVAALIAVRAPSASSARVLAAVDAQTPSGALESGDGLRDEAITIGDYGRLRLELPRARVGVQGPARIELARGALLLHEGTAEVDGRLPVAGANCRAAIDGRCALSRTGSQLQITLFAGSVHVEAPRIACSVIDLTGNAEPEPTTELTAPVEARPEPTAEGPATPEPSDRERGGARRPSTPSELALQVQAYREALALRGRDDRSAIERYREMNRRWPRSPLRHEIDLNLIDALTRSGQSDAAATEARRFLSRHPHSPKADEIRKSLGAPGTSGDGQRSRQE